MCIVCVPSSSVMMILVEFLSSCSWGSSGCKSTRLYSSGASKARLSSLMVKFRQMEKTLIEKVRVLLIISACIAVREVDQYGI